MSNPNNVTARALESSWRIKAEVPGPVSPGRDQISEWVGDVHTCMGIGGGHECINAVGNHTI
jgi:hypothetical protein